MKSLKNNYLPMLVRYQHLSFIKNIFLFGIVILMGFVLPGCEDMIKENIEDKTVTIVSPPNNYVSDELSISFQWDEVEGADEYKLEVWNDKSIRILNTIVDTIVYDYTFPYFGTFTWKLKATNGATETPFTTYTITIDSTDDISTTALVLTSPDDNYYTSSFDVTFEWDTLYNADDYRFELTDLDGISVDNSIITTNSYIDYTFDAEGEYIWWVRAQNASSNTQYSSRYITIDSTAPNTPSLLYPVEGDTVDAIPFTLSWNRWGESGSAITDSIYIARDSLFASILLADVASDSTYSYSATINDSTYYWFVKSIDAAGNESSNSDTSQFVVSQ